MKKLKYLFTIVILSICTYSHSQDKFTYNQEGLSPEFIVVELDSIDQGELFESSVNWIKNTYKNPDEVIKTTISNKKVRFEGYKSSLICVENIGISSCYNGTYTIELEFKDNKYKFTPLSIQFIAGSSVSINLKDGSHYYNRKGNLKNMYDKVPSSIENLLNDLNKSLKNYLEESTIESESSDDW